MTEQITATAFMDGITLNEIVSLVW